MPRVIPTEEFKLICEVERLGAAGLNATEIAGEVEKPATTLRYTLEKHGLEMTTNVQVRSKIGGIPLAELIQRGDILPAEAAEAVSR